MSYSKPRTPYKAGTHYRPIWADLEPEKPRGLTVKAADIQEAFPLLSSLQADKLALLYNAQGAIVPSERFAITDQSIARYIKAIRGAGVALEGKYDRGFALTAESLEFVRSRLAEVQG